MSIARRVVGADVSRTEGVAKTTGTARYSAEYPLAGLVYGYLVQATIAKGRVMRIDASAVLEDPSVLAVIDHTGAPRLGDAGDAEMLILQDDAVAFRGQVIAIVVARSLIAARAAADALVIEYDEQPHDTVLSLAHPGVYVPDHVNPANPTDRVHGDVDAALALAAATVDQTYSTPAEHNNPMEPHAATVHWVDGQLIAYDSNQGAARIQLQLAQLFDVPRASVRVIADHVGGGFGAKGNARAAVIAAAIAARLLDRPVRVVLTRQQQFSIGGYRTPTIQQVRLGADASGHLLALDHLALAQTSTVLEFAEQTAIYARTMYAAANLRTRHRMVALDVPTPRWMRAPGEAPGAFAIESALDELATELGLDPIDLRIRNEPDVEPDTGRPFSSRNLVACLRLGAERFGWADRDPRPGLRRDGRWLVGTGVAAATYPARSSPSTAAITAQADGRFTVRITASDVGTGARTTIGQVAADQLRTSLDSVDVLIGDSDFGIAQIAGGSAGMASWSWAVIKAADELLAALSDGAPLPCTVRVDTTDDVAAQANVVRHAFGAQFAEVRVDVDTGEVRVPRLFGVFAAGRVVNPKLARSQLIGGMTWGLSMALHEESIMDPVFGDYANHDLAGYHIASHADVLAIDAECIDEVDEQLGPGGIKGLGEIGIVGTAAAIANAVWHATGIRQRHLPLHPARVLQP